MNSKIKISNIKYIAIGIAVFLLISSVFGFFVYAVIEYDNTKSYQQALVSQSQGSVDKIAMIEIYKNIASKDVNQGTYYFSGNINGFDVETNMIVTDKKIYLEVGLKIGGSLYQSKANTDYEQIGSSLLFSNAQGDKILIPSVGSPIKVNSNELVFLGLKNVSENTIYKLKQAI